MWLVGRNEFVRDEERKKDGRGLAGDEGFLGGLALVGA